METMDWQEIWTQRRCCLFASYRNINTKIVIVVFSDFFFWIFLHSMLAGMGAGNLEYGTGLEDLAAPYVPYC